MWRVISTAIPTASRMQEQCNTDAGTHLHPAMAAPAMLITGDCKKEEAGERGCGSPPSLDSWGCAHDLLLLLRRSLPLLAGLWLCGQPAA